MRSFFLLLRIQLFALVNSLLPNRANMTASQRRGRIVFGCLGLALVTLLLLAYVSMLSLGLAASGLASVLPLLAILLTALQGVVFTFIKANGTLFGFKDYDLVMSLPISRATIVTSRMTALLCASEAMTLLTVPMFAVYFHAAALNAPNLSFSIFAAIVAVLLAPLVPTALAAFASFGITALTARLRHANIAYVAVATLCILAIVAGSFALSFNVSSMSGAEAIDSLGGIATVIEASIVHLYPPAAWASSAVIDGSLPGLLSYIIFSGVVTVACTALMQRYYLRINSVLAAHASTGGGERALKRRGGDTRSPFWAIVLKEWRTLVGIPTYAFNCLVGYLFVVGVGVLISVTGLDALLASGHINDLQINPSQIEGFLAPAQLAIPWVFAFCAIMCDSAVMSVSLEGRSAWLMSTLPVSTRTMLGAKLTSNALPFGASLLIGLVVMLASGAIGTSTALEIALIAFGSFLLWVGVGMSLDVKRPNFSWTSAQEVVKRGAPVMVCVICGIIYNMAAGTLVVLGSTKFGVEAMHTVNLMVGVITCAIGAYTLMRLIKRTPALYC